MSVESGNVIGIGTGIATGHGKPLQVKGIVSGYGIGEGAAYGRPLTVKGTVLGYGVGSGVAVGQEPSEYISGTPIDTPGEYAICVTAEDSAGNITESFCVNFVVLKQWFRASKLCTPNPLKSVKRAVLRVQGADYANNVEVTDILLQGGNVLTGWRPHNATGPDIVVITGIASGSGAGEGLAEAN